MKKILAAMSGGVDSTCAALALKRDGWQVLGVHMQTIDGPGDAAAAARKSAEEIGIEFRLLDLREEFKSVLEYFTATYLGGRTPNPCTFCNRSIKFGRLLAFADETGCAYLATGHYARVGETGGVWHLARGVDPEKDQSYMLSMIRRAVLPRLKFPLGGLTKKETFEIARAHGLAAADRAESQDVCFVPGGTDHGAWMLANDPGRASSGAILYRGRQVGTHRGIFRYTIGQRRGLGVAVGHPVFVKALDAAANTVVLGDRAEMFSARLSAECMNWLADVPDEFAAQAKIRYATPAANAHVVKTGPATVDVRFEKPAFAVTPGQTLALYDAERVLGGGIIVEGFTP